MGIKIYWEYYYTKKKKNKKKRKIIKYIIFRVIEGIIIASLIYIAQYAALYFNYKNF